MGSAKVGILTFHCADNYGAMLQAFGLKFYLREKGIQTDIIPYEPPFMTGRHWLIPYLPIGNAWECLLRGLTWGRGNLRMGKNYFARRIHMKRFRRKYLVEKGQRRLLFPSQLCRLSYSYYIVGSDQIWNPDITFGLRKEYFGAFENSRKEKVIAYGASLGGPSLSSEYDKEFSELLKSVDAISVREEEAISYVEQFSSGSVTAVPDPVFLLKEKEWQKIETLPDSEGYILLHMTEKNQKMIEYVKDLSKKTGRRVIELRSGAGSASKEFGSDYSAGPAEFLGYIHKADYVVTNSFHATAFSIIYQKRFLVFLHRSLGARISNILKMHGLENRLYCEGMRPEIDSPVDWIKVKKRTEEKVRIGEAFLLKHVGY